jgi:hypothetical protein
MEVELSPKSIARLADALAPRVAKIIKNEVMKPMEDANQEWISTKEAALILGMTQGNLRRCKDKYPHIKNGDNDQGNLRFLRSALIESFAK